MSGRRIVAAALVGASLIQPACRAGAPSAPAARPGARLVTDMRGVQVAVPSRLARVATVDDGFVESVMTRFGVIRTLVAVGSASLQDVWSYSYPTADGRGLTMRGGAGTMRALHPWLADLPCAACQGDAINYETMAAARADVAILRAGDCTLGTDPAGVARSADVVAAAGTPVVVLRSPADYRGEGLGTLRGEIEVLGRLFEREAEAGALADELAGAESMIRARVADVPEAERPRVLYLGLASRARASGGAAFVWGTDTTESWMIERVLGARNAYRGPGARVLLNAEQILALDPDVIFLPTSAGYHPPLELAEAPYFRELQRLRAVRSGRVYPLPWTPFNCARRLEYPLDLLIMAKGAYPGRFGDVAVHEWSLQFYARTYRIDRAQAAALRRAQWLDWMEASGF